MSPLMTLVQDYDGRVYYCRPRYKVSKIGAEYKLLTEDILEVADLLVCVSIK